MLTSGYFTETVLGTFGGREQEKKTGKTNAFITEQLAYVHPTRLYLLMGWGKWRSIYTVSAQHACEIPTATIHFVFLKKRNSKQLSLKSQYTSTTPFLE